MRWLADECVAASLVAFLRSIDHNVLYVAEAAAGFSDAEVIALALSENRLLLTEDKDFGDLVFRRERAVPGVVLMRVGPENPALKAMRRQSRDMAQAALAATWLSRRDASGPVDCGAQHSREV